MTNMEEDVTTARSWTAASTIATNTLGTSRQSHTESHFQDAERRGPGYPMVGYDVTLNGAWQKRDPSITIACTREESMYSSNG